MKFGKKLSLGLKITLIGLIVAIIAWLLELLYAFVIAITDNIYVLLIGAIVLLVLILFAQGHIAQKILKIR